MKFTVNATALNKQLSRIVGVVSSSPLVPILENVLIEAKADKLVLTASDLQTQMAVSVPAKGNGTTSIAAPAKPLLDIIKNLPDQGITIEIDGTHLRIISDNGVYNLGGEDAVDFPREWGIKNAKEFTIDASELDTALETTLFATAEDDLMPHKGGVCFHKKEGKINFVATDNHRLAKYTVDNDEEGEFELTVPRKSLNVLKQLTQDNLLITSKYNEEFISFNNGLVHLRTKLIDVKYPPYEMVIPKNNDKIAVVNRRNLISALKRIAICSDKVTNMVKVSLSGNVLEIAAEDTAYDRTAKETLAVDYSAEPFEICFHGRQLQEILSHIVTDEVLLTFSGPSKSVLIFPKDDENTVMLLVPVFLNKPVAVEA